jgi:hypothetical protein
VKQEYFDDFFRTNGMDAQACMERTEQILVSLRRVAAEIAKEWLLTNGHFNGEITSEVFVYSDIQQCNVQVVLTDFGLPNRVEAAP